MYAITGWGSFVLKENLTLLKFDIKEWSSGKFGEVGDFDRIQEDINLSEVECVLLKEVKAKWWKLKKAKDIYNYQKARIQRIHEGDTNSTFFHKCINKRHVQTKLMGL